VNSTTTATIPVVTPETSGLSAETLAVIREALASFGSVESALLFGSRAKGTFHAGSDVDIALIGGDTLLAMDVSSHLNECVPLPYFFDVAVLADVANMPLGEHIERVQTLLFERNNYQHIYSSDLKNAL
jgi:type I restriction enzyme R subunit